MSQEDQMKVIRERQMPERYYLRGKGGRKYEGKEGGKIA